MKSIFSSRKNSKEGDISIGKVEPPALTTTTSALRIMPSSSSSIPVYTSTTYPSSSFNNNNNINGDNLQSNNNYNLSSSFPPPTSTAVPFPTSAASSSSSSSYMASFFSSPGQAPSSSLPPSFLRSPPTSASPLDIQSVSQTSQRPLNIALPSTAVFGTPLEELLKREALDRRNARMEEEDSASNTRNSVPSIVALLVHFLSQRTVIQTKGIFRVSSSARSLENLRETIDMGQRIHLDSIRDVFLAADLLKLYLRRLPDSPVPKSEYEKFLKTMEEPSHTMKMESLRKAIQALPAANFSLLSYLTTFLKKVSLVSDNNGMTTSNLAMMFAPNIIRAPDGSGLFAMETEKNIVEMMIDHHQTLFAGLSSPVLNDDSDSLGLSSDSIENDIQDIMGQGAVTTSPAKKSESFADGQSTRSSPDHHRHDLSSPVPSEVLNNAVRNTVKSAIFAPTEQYPPTTTSGLTTPSFMSPHLTATTHHDFDSSVNESDAEGSLPPSNPQSFLNELKQMQIKKGRRSAADSGEVSEVENTHKDKAVLRREEEPPALLPSLTKNRVKPQYRGKRSSSVTNTASHATSNASVASDGDQIDSELDDAALAASPRPDAVPVIEEESHKEATAREEDAELARIEKALDESSSLERAPASDKEQGVSAIQPVALAPATPSSAAGAVELPKVALKESSLVNGFSDDSLLASLSVSKEQVTQPEVSLPPSAPSDAQRQTLEPQTLTSSTRPPVPTASMATNSSGTPVSSAVPFPAVSGVNTIPPATSQERLLTQPVTVATADAAGPRRVSIGNGGHLNSRRSSQERPLIQPSSTVEKSIPSRVVDSRRSSQERLAVKTNVEKPIERLTMQDYQQLRRNASILFDQIKAKNVDDDTVIDDMERYRQLKQFLAKAAVQFEPSPPSRSKGKQAIRQQPTTAQRSSPQKKSLPTEAVPVSPTLVQQSLDRLSADRRAHNRPDKIIGMDLNQLKAEKEKTKLEIKYLKSVLGSEEERRRLTRADREAAKALYERYGDIKTLLERHGGIGVRPPSKSTGGKSDGHGMMSGAAPMIRSLVAATSATTSSSEAKKSPSATALADPDAMLSLKEEKRRLQTFLHNFHKKFEQIHNRQIETPEDRAPVEAEYQRYLQVKSILAQSK